MSVPPPPPPYNPGGVPTPPPYPGVPPGYQQYAPMPGMGYGGQPAYASFGARLGAMLIDGLIGAIFSAPAVIAILAGPKHLTSCTVDDRPGYCKVPNGGTWAIFGVLAAAGLVVFLVLLCRKISKNQSWGMKVTGIRVVGADTGQPISVARALGWHLAHVFSGFFCALGYFWMLWDKRKQCFHDKIASTLVVKA